MLLTKIIQTPIGEMRMAATEQGLCLCDFVYRRSIDRILQRIERLSGHTQEEGEHPLFVETEQQLKAYFDGSLRHFDLPLHLLGSPFQVRVWQALLEVPYGRTRSYKQQAEVVGDVLGIRAVASANGQNGLAIIVPCHRIIGSNGSLTGYGGGLDRKKWLLEHERSHEGAAQQASLF